MSLQEYMEFFTRLHRLYAERRYGDALGLLNEQEDRFPERASMLAHVRACLHGVDGKPDLALAVLRDAVSRGAWWSERRLRDPDLDSVREHPDFVALATEVAGVREAARAEAVPRRPELALFPAQADPARGVLVALHMYGATARETAGFWRHATSSGLTVAVPESTQRDADGNPCWDDDVLTERDVRVAFEEAVAAHPSGEHHLLAGASQGGRLAVSMAIDGRPFVSRGFIGVVCFPELEPLGGAVEAAAGSVRGFLLAGAEDPITPQAEASCAELNRRGLACGLQVVPGLGHYYPADFPERVAAAIELSWDPK